jgi:hypothetical protein
VSFKYLVTSLSGLFVRSSAVVCQNESGVLIAQVLNQPIDCGGSIATIIVAQGSGIGQRLASFLRDPSAGGPSAKITTSCSIRRKRRLRSQTGVFPFKPILSQLTKGVLIFRDNNRYHGNSGETTPVKLPGSDLDEGPILDIGNLVNIITILDDPLPAIATWTPRNPRRRMETTLQ